MRDNVTRLILLLAVSNQMFGCQHAPRFGEKLDKNFAVQLVELPIGNCPENAIEILKQEVSEDSWKATAGRTINGPYCQGFFTYKFEKQVSKSESFQIEPVYGHIEYPPSGKSCTLVIAAPDEKLCRGDHAELCAPFSDSGKYFRFIAHFFTLQASEISKTEQFSTMTDFGRWCRMRIRKKLSGTTSSSSTDDE